MFRLKRNNKAVDTHELIKFKLHYVQIKTDMPRKIIFDNCVI